MFSLYALGVIAAALTALIFKRTLLKGRPQAFILEMPTYKVPAALAGRAAGLGEYEGVRREGGDDHLLPECHPVGGNVFPAAAQFPNCKGRDGRKSSLASNRS
jgi:hypothetical protein